MTWVTTVSSDFAHIYNLERLEAMMKRAEREERYEDAEKLRKRYEELFIERAEIKIIPGAEVRLIIRS